MLLLSGLLLAACGLAVYFAWTFDPLERDAVARDEPGRGARGGGSGRADRGAHERGHGASLVDQGGTGWTHHDWSQETELSRATALNLPGPTFWREAAAGGRAGDPQLLAMWRSFHHLAPEHGETPPLPFEPTAHRAELVEATGDASRTPSSCDVRVLPVATSEFSCVVRVMCDGRVLYPNPSQTAGYVRCDVENGRPVRAVDSGFTANDGDPAVDLDLARGTVRVEEYDAEGRPTYSATLRIQS
ncbi:MAG: hypothetical protein KF729_36525 [Sandaracinaceae bacterium]|nr:hypothetical protein [Sandaracinaceae bacterium]